MRRFEKSKIILYLNIIIALVLLIVAIICFTLMNTTTVFIGIDLYLIFAIAFILFSLPFIVKIINYLLLPNTVITFNKNDIIIHKRKKDIQIANNKILSVSKTKMFSFIYGVDVGNIKILVQNLEKPVYINFVDEVDKAYEMIDVIILKQYNEILQKKSAEM